MRSQSEHANALLTRCSADNEAQIRMLTDENRTAHQALDVERRMASKTHSEKESEFQRRIQVPSPLQQCCPSSL